MAIQDVVLMYTICFIIIELNTQILFSEVVGVSISISEACLFGLISSC